MALQTIYTRGVAGGGRRDSDATAWEKTNANVRALAALGASRAPAVLAALGSSTVERGSGLSGNNLMRYAWGVATWAEILSGGRLHMPFSANFGISGQTTEQMLPRVAAVLAHDPLPDWCLMPLGTNDGLNDVPLATFRANAAAIVERLAQAGIRPVLLVPHPVLGQASAAQLRLARNAEVVRRIAADSGALLVDCLDEMMDPTGAAYAPYAAMMADNLHLSPRGAFVMGRAVARAIAAAGLADRTPLLRSAADIYDAASNPYGSLTPNPMLTGSGGTVSPGPVGGTIPAGWVAANFLGGGTVSLAAVTAGGKAWSEATIGGTYGGGEGQFSLYCDATAANVAAGDRLYATAEVDASGLSNFGSVALCITTTQGGQTFESWDCWPMDGDGPDQDWNGVLRTPTLTIAAAPTLVRMRIRVYVKRGLSSGAIAGAVRLRAACIRKE